MSLSNAEIQKLRETVRTKVAEQAAKDPAFKEKLRSDPEATLAEAGVPSEAIPDLIRETGLGDVTGYVANCPVTCVVSCPIATVSV